MNPAELDTAQWVAAAEAMGAKYIVFVAKHVGGFCMWQTETTDYSVKSIPWRGGQGDVLGDLAASCRQRGMKLGVYLSPCDGKHGAGVGGRCRSPEEQQRYNDLYRRQLTEVLTRYGEMFEVWFDGSNVVPVSDLLRKHAPRAMVFQGPDATIRWVGNESGVAPYPAWNSLPVAEAKSGVATARHGDPQGKAWMPNECDARIRESWFWNSHNAGSLKSVEELMEMYYQSVGHGAVLLLNQTPDTTGKIPAADVLRGAEFGAEIKRRFGQSLAETTGEGAAVELALPKAMAVDHVITMENILDGERIREYVIEGWAGNAWQPLCQGTAVGHKKIDRFAPTEVTKIRLRVVKSAAPPRIRKLAAYSVFGAAEPPEPPAQAPVGHWTGDEIRDGAVPDASGKQRHGKAHGVTTEQGRIGNGLRFNGRDSFISLGELEAFRGDFTIAAWVNPAPAGRGVRCLVSKETTNVGANQCRFYLAAGNRLGFMMSGFGEAHLWPFEARDAVVPTDAWSHVAVTRRGANFVLYLNGKAVGTKASPGMIYHRNSADVKLGANFDTSGRPVQVFDGLLDDVRLYNRALAAEEVATLGAGGTQDAAWTWKPGQLKADWQPVDIDITPFCKEAGQYEVTFRKTAGRGDIELQSLTLFCDNRETPEWIQRTNKPNSYVATLPGVGVPLRLRATVRSQGGSDSAGSVVIRRRP
jgi:alpha-L-fucosidase